jgi:hypothetical protein
MVTLAIRLIRFLFTTIAGLSILAGLGLLFVCGGIASFFGNPETQATTVTLKDVEARSELPKQQWLRLTDGYLVWPHTKELVTTRKKRGSGEVTSVQTKTIYVPLVSKALLDAWRQQGTDRPFPSSKIRVFVKMEPAAVQKDFPQDAAELSNQQVDPDRLKVQTAVSGLAGSLQDEDKVVREGLSKDAAGLDPKGVLVLRYGEQPPTKGAMVGGGVVMLLLGLALAVPLVLRLACGKAAAPAGGGGLHQAVLAGFEDGVRASVRGAVAAGVAAGSAAAPPVARAAGPAAAVPVARPVQFYYVLNGQRFGPVAHQQLRALWKAGRLPPESLVWQEGTKDWVPAANLTALLH